MYSFFVHINQPTNKGVYTKHAHSYRISTHLCSVENEVEVHLSTELDFVWDKSSYRGGKRIQLKLLKTSNQKESFLVLMLT